jgi:lipoprotein-releasing system ATP-binding protein
MMPALIAGRNGRDTTNRARQLLADVGLAARASHRPGELSGGEQQRVAVARALMNEPRVVLADEPSGNLDRQSSESLHQLLWDLSRRDARAFIIVTHNAELAQKADRVIELFDGRIKKIHQNTGH